MGVQVSHAEPYVREPGVLAVSRQIRSETLPIWYGENVFHINGSSPAVKFLRSRYDDQLRNLRTLHVDSVNYLGLQYAQDRIKQLLKEFGRRGLSRSAIRYRVPPSTGSVWAGLERLAEIESAGDEL